MSNPRPDLTTPDTISHEQLLAQIDACSLLVRDQARELRLLLDYTDPFGPSPLGAPLPSHDGYDCEICGEPVPAPEMEPFAARHGAVCHVNCLTVQMNNR